MSTFDILKTNIRFLYIWSNEYYSDMVIDQFHYNNLLEQL